MVDPNIKLGFGGQDGLRMLRGHLTGADAPEYWRSLGRILALGGAFKGASAFEAPYVFANWPEGTDAFECLAVTGANVAVRKEGHPDAVLLTRTSYAIVRLARRNIRKQGWTMVAAVDRPEGLHPQRLPVGLNRAARGLQPDQRRMAHDRTCVGRLTPFKDLST
jgi:hypothetical protein